MEGNFTDKNTVDQAWDSMKDILDKEMPIKEKRRRIPFLFLLIGGGLLLGASYMTYMSFSSVPPEQNNKGVPSDNEISKKIATTESDEINTTKSISEIEIVTNQEEIPSPKTKNESNITSANPNKSKQAKSSVSPLTDMATSVHSVSKSQATHVVVTNAPPKNENLKLKNEDPLQDQLEIVPPTINPNEMLLIDDDKDAERISLIDEMLMEDPESEFQLSPVLPLITSYTVLGPSKDVDLDTKIHGSVPSSKLSTKKWEWAIHAYGIQRIGGTRPIVNFSSFGKGGGVEVLLSRRLNSKWHIGTGLGYRQSGSSISLGGQMDTNTLPLTISVNEAAFAPNNDFNLIEGEVSLFNAQSNVLVVSTNQFLSLPIFVQRSIGARWALEAGIRYNQKIGNFDTQFFQLARKSNVDFYITPSYRLSKDWSLGLMLQQVTNQFNRENTIVTKELGRTQLGISIRFRM